MFCVFCDTGHEDDNYCEDCAIELAPAMEWLADLLGESRWRDWPAPMGWHNTRDSHLLKTYFAGAGMSWDVLMESNGSGPYKFNGKIVRIDAPIFTPSVWLCET